VGHWIGRLLGNRIGGVRSEFPGPTGNLPDFGAAAGLTPRARSRGRAPTQADDVAPCGVWAMSSSASII